MKLPALTIFGRTFFLMLAALVVANAVGLALLISRPPMHNAPVRLSEIARELSGADNRGPPPRGFDRAFGPGGPGGAGGPGEVGSPGGAGGPPPDARGFDHGPPPGGPPPGMPMGPDRARREWRMRDSAAPPAAPRGVDQAESQRLTALLATRLGVGGDRARIYVTEAAVPGGRAGFGDPQLREGFTAAWLRDDGQWRVMESVVEGFPNAFQRQALWLLAIGLAVLLPVSWLFARALAAPIRRFSDGARRLGLDPQHAPPLEHGGPREMQRAIESFNAMQGRVTRLLEERSRMVGAIAHDLRTPLMRLAFRLEGLESPLKEKVEGDLSEMKAMISAVLDFLRDQSARGARQRLDLKLLVESVVDDQSDVGHDVTFETDGAPESVIVEGDPLSLRRMMVNLVENARKYGERARLALEVTGETCAIRVDDDGPGIPEALQQRVFEPFFRTEASRNRDTGGIGLGLTTVRAIALDHGGSVELLNLKQGGLRVIVSLPMPGR